MRIDSDSLGIPSVPALLAVRQRVWTLGRDGGEKAASLCGAGAAARL